MHGPRNKAFPERKNRITEPQLPPGIEPAHESLYSPRVGRRCLACDIRSVGLSSRPVGSPGTVRSGTGRLLLPLVSRPSLWEFSSYHAGSLGRSLVGESLVRSTWVLESELRGTLPRSTINFLLGLHTAPHPIRAQTKVFVVHAARYRNYHRCPIPHHYHLHYHYQ